MRTEGGPLRPHLALYQPQQLLGLCWDLISTPGLTLHCLLISPVPAPSAPRPFPTSLLSSLLHLSLLPLGLRYEEGPVGEVVVSIQPPELGVFLSVCLFLGLRSQTSQVLWEPNSYLPKDLKSKRTRSASPPSSSPFLKALFYTCIEPRATALVLATLLKGILQACGRGLETWQGAGEPAFVLIPWFLTPFPSVEKCQDRLAYPRPSSLFLS